MQSESRCFIMKDYQKKKGIDMSLMDCILMTVFNAAVCICLPSLLMGIKSRSKTQNNIGDRAESQTVSERAAQAAL